MCSLRSVSSIPLRKTDTMAGSPGMYGRRPSALRTEPCRRKALTALAIAAVSNAAECTSQTSASSIGMLTSGGRGGSGSRRTSLCRRKSCAAQFAEWRHGLLMRC